jgi:hypothetical protein
LSSRGGNKVNKYGNKKNKYGNTKNRWEEGFKEVLTFDYSNEN